MRLLNIDGFMVDFKGYKVIYELMEEVEEQMKLLVPKQLVVVGKATVKQLFTLTGARKAVVAGSSVTSGTVTVGSSARCVRDGEIVWDGSVAALQRLKDQVTTVDSGTECGITLDGFDTVREGDVIEVYEIKRPDE